MLCNKYASFPIIAKCDMTEEILFKLNNNALVFRKKLTALASPYLYALIDAQEEENRVAESEAHYAKLH